MKSKMIALWISMGVLACLISFFLGKHYSLFTPESERNGNAELHGTDEAVARK
ncbi:MAG: hypothetical protein IPL39_08370 [Opitutaceae bacterium]|nr:hypothetical protein [Opitutaceae bacterium]